MQKRLILILLSSSGIFILLLSIMLTVPVMAQTVTATPTVFVGTPAPVMFPGVAPVQYVTPTPVNLTESGCFLTQAGLAVDTWGYIKAGVLLRHLPTRSGAIVNYTTENIDVQILEGPICADGYQWWRVVGVSMGGWVAEGRPDEDGFFLFPYGVEPDASQCSSVYEMAAGKTAEIYVNTRVRAEAGSQGLVKTVAPAGSSVLVLEGPQCVEGANWWKVRVTVANAPYEGWMAESGDGIYWLVPDDAPNSEDGTLCGVPLDLAEGTRGIVRYRDNTPKYLRSAPGVESGAMFSLVNNVPFIVAGGPVCKGNMNWWKIRVLASNEVIGWIAEGSQGVGYWIRPLNDVYSSDRR